MKNRVTINESRLSLIMTILFLIIGIMGFSLTVIKYNNRQKATDSTIVKQVETMDNMKENLTQLISFIDIQKNKIIEEQQVLDRLKKERNDIEPIIKTNKETIDAILKVHSENQKSNIWLDRAIGFFLGIIGSILASFIYGYIKRVRLSSKNHD